MNPEKDALHALWSHKGAGLAFLFSGLLLAAMGVGWFWIPDARSGLVGLSFAGLLAVGSALLCWIGATFAYFSQAHLPGSPRLGGAIRSAASHLPALWLWLLIAAAAAWLLHPAVLILLAPLAGAVAVHGWRGFLRPGWRIRFFPSLVFVAGAASLLAWGLWLWRPVQGDIQAEALSLAARAGAGYLAAVSGWLYLASLLGRLQAESPSPSS
jgi:hypothetical protein